MVIKPISRMFFNSYVFFKNFNLVQLIYCFIAYSFGVICKNPLFMPKVKDLLPYVCLFVCFLTMPYFPTSDLTHNPCTGSQCLKYWATVEVLQGCFFKRLFRNLMKANLLILLTVRFVILGLCYFRC